MTSTRSNAVCLGCGCACDDIGVRVEDGRIAAAARACALGAAWFGDGRAPARARAGGRDVPYDEAVDAAARMLDEATRPLVYLAPDLTCEAQRAAIALADVLGAGLDSVTSAGALPSVLASQELGRVSATLGEVRHRADVVVYWGVDPGVRYPRYVERYAHGAPGMHLAGREARTVVAVDVGDARGPGDAGRRIACQARDEVAVLTALTALVHGQPESLPDDGPWAAARELLPVLLGGRYVVIVADAERAGDGVPGDAGRPAALVRLVQALNGPTRAALSSLRGGGNRTGADAALTAQTGYPVAVDFSRGVPRYRPHDGTAGARLARGEVDALLVLGSASALPPDLVAVMAGVTAAAIGPRASDGPLAGVQVVVDTGMAGIHDAGTVLRLDDVPLPAPALLEGPPAAAEVITSVAGRLRTGRAPVQA